VSGGGQSPFEPGGEPVIAGGAGHYRQPGLVERVARVLSAIPMSAAVRSQLKRWYVAALTAQCGGKGLLASLPGGETVRVLPEHGHLGWNPDEYRAFRDAVRPGMTALDVGANVGAYALLLGQWVGAAGTVYAFEPAPATYDGLVRHIHLNGLGSIVHPVQAALGASAATAWLLSDGTGGESRLAAPSERTAGAISVTVTTIDEFCETHHLTPAFIKVDVEGAELAVLRGARETIRRCRPELALFVEMHPTVWRTIGVARAAMIDELARQSLEVAAIMPSQDPWSLEGVCVRLTAA
jgi:FkbM family methyltransferase